MSTPRAPGHVLAVDGAHKEYGELVALDRVGFFVDEGEVVALVGHNGSGKSTLLRLVAGLLDLTGGSVEVCGSPAGSLAARAAVSYVPDEPILYDDLSVAEHVEYVCRLHGMPGAPPETQALLKRLHLAARAHELPSRFSRGLRQRVSLALGLVRPFRLLLVDEPFVGLDPQGQEACADLLVGAAEAGAAVVVATHQLPFLDRATRCVMLRDGSVVHAGAVTSGVVQELQG